MRGLVMTPRSVYNGLACLRCGRNIQNGRAFFGSTYFVNAKRPTWVRTFSMGDGNPDELRLRVTYHRTCFETALASAPLDPEAAISRLEEYRLQLVERYGVEDT